MQNDPTVQALRDKANALDREANLIETALLLDPHGDDAVLFAAFTLLRHRPNVIVCLTSQVQENRGGPTAAIRERETSDALGELGIYEWEQWRVKDDRPDWVAVTRLMEDAKKAYEPEIVFAPEFEVGGHEHHNAIAEIAARVFGPDRVQSYLTYVRGSARSDWGTEVVPEPEWIGWKHRALSCFTSQIREPSTRPWFMDSLREWVA